MTRFRPRLLDTSRWLLVMLCGASLAYAQSAQEIAKKSFGSTVILVIEDAHGRPLSLGSGFFARDGEIASNLQDAASRRSGSLGEVPAPCLTRLLLHGLPPSSVYL